MLKNVTHIQIEEEKFDIVVNVGTMIDVENETGKDFMTLAKETEKGSIVALSSMLACCLCKDGKPVGIDFIREMDFDVFSSLLNPLIDSIIKAFPTDKKNEITANPMKK